jgi:hypothetical protein
MARQRVKAPSALSVKKVKTGQSNKIKKKTADRKLQA